jgi:hypothetical protein
VDLGVKHGLDVVVEIGFFLNRGVDEEKVTNI